MQHNPYKAPNKPVTSDKGGITEPEPLQTLISLFEMLVGGAGAILFFMAAFTSIKVALIGLPFLAIASLISWSGMMLWRNNRYAWLPVSIVAVPINLMTAYLWAWNYQLIPHSNRDSLKEAVQNPHIIDTKITMGPTVFSLLLLACAIYSFAIRNSMPQTRRSTANPDPKI